MWIIAALLCFTAGLYRIARGRNRRQQVWWWSFTTALLGVGAGAVLLGTQVQLNRALGIPNLAFLLSQVAFIAAAGSVQIYAHTLRHIPPSARAIKVHALTAVAVVTLDTIGWIAAPIHRVDYGGIDNIPLFYPPALSYEVLYNAYFGVVLFNVARTAGGQIRSTPTSDRSRRVGLFLVAAGAALAVIALGCNLVHDLVEPVAGLNAAKPWTEAGDVLVIGCLVGIALGAVTFLLGPDLAARQKAARNLKQMHPLWLRLRALYPGIVLGAAGRHSLRYRTDRMMIEISDGLRHLPVTADPASGDSGAIGAVVDALIDPPGHGTPAAEVLPAPVDQATEQQLAASLAGDYNRRTATTITTETTAPARPPARPVDHAS